MAGYYDEPDNSQGYVQAAFASRAEADAYAEEIAAEDPKAHISIEVERDPRRWWQVIVWV